jgi:Arc/MetJ-type ribon-helix-helix transcriptional regulator
MEEKENMIGGTTLVPMGFVVLLDELGEKYDLSRSEMIREAITLYLNTKDHQRLIKGNGKKIISFNLDGEQLEKMKDLLVKNDEDSGVFLSKSQIVREAVRDFLIKGLVSKRFFRRIQRENPNQKQKQEEPISNKNKKEFKIGNKEIKVIRVLNNK